jgi:hypothetical protein
MTPDQWIDAELAQTTDVDRERLAYVADKLAAALRDLDIAYAEALGLNAELDRMLTAARHYAGDAFDLVAGDSVEVR